ncbi:Histidine kinase-, DNA gyrase B-, and HSP90-like ATPase [Flavobacterium sp. 9AF]|uniref:hybrid sensor histidine kinase/response regulator transcription factor n=1 Tax=Flavobacterium sp. 9AF TaxID=2653142 RepID=UPI0012EEF180|nr:response regulator [Flavobacterium sp. 9AF]VXB70458.1 Histidine kinase-, DNA gyrase B-, and HSP90-like ATPase [Flavobacterium sp. 9AF]
MKNIFILTLSFYITFLGFSQKKSSSDSLTLYFQKADSTYNILNYKISLEYAQQALKVAKQKNDSYVINEAKIKIASAYQKLRLQDYALKILNEITLQKNPSKKEIIQFATILNAKGNAYYSNYEDDLAISHYLKADSISEAYNYKNDSQIKALQNIGLMFLRGYKTKNKSGYGRAKDYFKRAYDIAKATNSFTEMHFSGLYYGSTFVETENPEPQIALTYYNNAKKYFEANNLIKELNDTYWAFASLYRRLGQNDKAETYYLENIEKNKLYPNLINLGKAYWAYASFLNAIQSNEKAITAYQNAISTLKQEKNTDLGVLSDCLYHIANLYHSKDQNALAFEKMNEYIIYKDSVDSKKNSISFNELEIKYQTEKKEQEIALLTSKHQVAQKQKYIYITISLLLLATGLFLFFGYKNKIRTAQKLKEINTLKSQFFANISHEFRTPLTLINSPLQLLKKQASDTQEKQLKLIENNSNRMLELVDQLLELSKIDSGQLQLIVKEGNLNDFLHSISEPFQYLAQEANKELELHFDIPKENYPFDKDVLEKITTNLLHNAIKYSDEATPIKGEFLVENQTLKVSIRNSNATLTKTDLQRLFDRFYQKNTHQKGAGIGLALVKELIGLYEGTIHTNLENDLLTIAFEIPLHMHLKNAIISHSNENEFVSNLLISQEQNNEISDELPVLLIADDNASIRSVLKDIFKDEFKIYEAENGKEALKIAEKEIPDCIVSDVMMPKVDGLEFTKQIKSNELTSFIPVILLTAKTTSEVHLEAIKNEADAFLTKPFQHEIVKQTVLQQIIERKKLQKRYSQELILKPTEVLINSVDEKFISKLEEVIHSEITNQEFNTEAFAEKMHISRMQLHRKLKSLFGVSTTEFIRNERLKIALELLKNEKLTVSEIAYSVGFNDVYYFSKCFKDLYQKAPSEYYKK